MRCGARRSAWPRAKSSPTTRGWSATISGSMLHRCCSRGVPLDRIYLRPWWWPWRKRERTVVPNDVRRIDGRACSPERRRVAVLSPYFPYPLSHGGAVRIYHLLREIAREFDVELFAF